MKMAGGANCPTGLTLSTQAECEAAGAEFGYPFQSLAGPATNRPGGCFWDQNGRAYLNRNLEANPGLWSGVGALCYSGQCPHFLRVHEAVRTLFTAVQQPKAQDVVVKG